MNVGSVANKVINVGKDVVYGMRGDYAGFTKEFGKKVLKSNMTEAQIKDMAKKGFETVSSSATNKKIIRDAAAAALGEKIGDPVKQKMIDTTAKLGKKGLSKQQVHNIMKGGGGWGQGVSDRMIGNALAKNNMAFKIGDAIGGGVRDTMRARKAGHDFKTALNAGFTKAGENGVRQIRYDRVAGAAFGASVVGRVATGGGLYRDRYGRVNAPGIPFI